MKNFSKTVSSLSGRCTVFRNFSGAQTGNKKTPNNKKLFKINTRSSSDRLRRSHAIYEVYYKKHEYTKNFGQDAGHSQIIILIPVRSLDIDLPFCCASLVVGGHEKAASRIHGLG